MHASGAKYEHLHLRLLFTTVALGYNDFVAPTPPYHRHRRKGARNRLEKRKTRRQEPCISTPPVSCLSPTLPSKWLTQQAPPSTQFFKVSGEDKCSIAASVVLHTDGTWSAFMKEHKIPPDHHLLAEFPIHLLESGVLGELIATIDGAFFCPGNSDEKYVALCRRRGGKIHGERGYGEVIGHIDTSSISGGIAILLFPTFCSYECYV